MTEGNTFEVGQIFTLKNPSHTCMYANVYYWRVNGLKQMMHKFTKESFKAVCHGMSQVKVMTKVGAMCVEHKLFKMKFL